MRFRGKTWKFGANIDTDLIISGRYLNTWDPRILAKHCLEDAEPGFAQKINPGDIIVADRNFGCGSSREHAPLAIKAAGISCVIAKSFARIFYRNAFNMGLPIFESVELVENTFGGDELEVDAASGEIINQKRNKKFKANPIPDFMQELIACGGLMKYAQKKQLDKR